MAVLIGSARIDENGKAHGGKAGDQTGKEVSTQNWYKHEKGWRVLRAKDAGAAAKIAAAMRAACSNSKIGYDQYQRNTLYDAAKPVGFDPAKVTKSVETDCSALVRVCCAYAGIMLGDFTTGNQASVMLASGKFEELTGSKYTAKSDYLRAGDVLVTKSKGHTVVVLTDGPASGAHDLGSRILKNGMSGSDVQDLQKALIKLHYDCGPDGADGEYGPKTEDAVEQFQRDHGLTADGDYGPNTHSALMNALDGAPEVEAGQVVIQGGDCHLRLGPGKEYDSAGIAKEGSTLDSPGTSGWVPVKSGDRVLWASAMYAKVGD